MYLRLAVSVYSLVEIVYLLTVECFFKCKSFCALLNAINMPRTALSCCPQQAARDRHVDGVTSLRTASAKEMAFEVVAPLGRNVYLIWKRFLLARSLTLSKWSNVSENLLLQSTTRHACTCWRSCHNSHRYRITFVQSIKTVNMFHQRKKYIFFFPVKF